MVVHKSREAFSECQAMGQVFLTCPCTYFTPLVTFWTVNYYAHFTDEKTEALSDWPQSVLPSVSHRTEYQTQTHIPCLLHLSASGSMNPLHATASAGSLSASGLSLVLWILSYGQAWHNCQGAGWLCCRMGMSVVRSRTRTCRKGEFSLVLWCLWPEALGESRTGGRIRGLPLLSAVGTACALYCLGCCQFDSRRS